MAERAPAAARDCSSGSGSGSDKQNDKDKESDSAPLALPRVRYSRVGELRAPRIRPADRPDHAGAGNDGESSNSNNNQNNAENSSSTKKKGHFSRAEKRAIIRAIDAFVEANGVDRAQLWPGYLANPDRKRARPFWAAVAQALPARDIVAVRACARRMFHPDNFNGSFTPDEDAELRRLVLVAGNNWTRIAEQLGKHPHITRERAQKLAQLDRSAAEDTPPARGRFSDDEERRFLEVVRRVEARALRKSETLLPLEAIAQKSDLAAGSFWELVAHEMPGRTQNQCFMKWSRSTRKGILIKAGLWRVKDDIRMLKWIKKQRPPDRSEINLDAATAYLRGKTRAKEITRSFVEYNLSALTDQYSKRKRCRSDYAQWGYCDFVQYMVEELKLKRADEKKAKREERARKRKERERAQPEASASPQKKKKKKTRVTELEAGVASAQREP